jgi:hypothetical protein
MGSLGRNEFYFVFFFPCEKEENECVRGELVIMCEEMLFMEKKIVKIYIYGRKLCVASSYSGVHVS